MPETKSLTFENLSSKANGICGPDGCSILEHKKATEEKKQKQLEEVRKATRNQRFKYGISSGFSNINKNNKLNNNEQRARWLK